MSVQCYAWTEKSQNINLPVCVCPSVSVNSPTGQTPQRIFKRRGFTQGCAFWGFRWWI